MDNNVEFLIILISFIVIGPAILYLILAPSIKDSKIRKNVMNYDFNAMNYCFKLPCGKDKAFQIMAVNDPKDTLSYDFDLLTSTVSFPGEFGGEFGYTYTLRFYPVNEETYLKVSCQHFFRGKSNLPFMINEFFVKKLGAVPFDYRRFDAVVGSDPN